jgi:hypothetical protein
MSKALKSVVGVMVGGHADGVEIDIDASDDYPDVVPVQSKITGLTTEYHRRPIGKYLQNKSHKVVDGIGYVYFDHELQDE